MMLEDKVSVLEAVLFATGEPIDSSRISSACGVELSSVDTLVEMLNDRYEKCDSALRVLCLERSFQLATLPRYATYIRQALETKRATPLSMAAMEVLTVVAYNQPVSKTFVESIRGVDSSKIINSLVDKELLEEAGRLNIPGKPISYRTTENFLRCFQLNSLSELPSPPPDFGQISFDN